MSARAAAWLAWSLAGLSMVMFVATVALSISSLYVAPATQPSSTGSTLGDLLLFVPFLAFPLVGALIASKRPTNAIGWICLAAGLFWMLIFLWGSTPSSVSAPVMIDALTQWLWVPPVGLLGIYMILLFPDGKLPSRRWRPLAWFSGGVMVLLSAGISKPFGLEQYPWVSDAFPVVLALLPLCILASAASLVLRYRRAGSEVREQIKWVAFAALFVGVLFVIDIGASVLLVPTSASGREPQWLAFLDQVGFISFAGVPIAVGIAVLKDRLYDIDRIINRTLVYGSLTVTLAVIYLGSVTATEALFRSLTGQEKQPQIAIVVSTLVIAALYGRLSRSLQDIIDRRFYRRKYDAAKTLEAFSAKLRQETDLDALSDDLVGVVRETMQPAHVSLWLRPDTALKVKQED